MDTQKLLESKSIIQMLANGINPIDQTPLQEESFLHDSRIVRPLFYLSEYISKEIDKKNSPRTKPKKFFITDDQLVEVKLPAGKIGINEFARAINKVINPLESKKLTGVMVNKKLKELGILSESVDENGRRNTINNYKRKIRRIRN